MSKIDPYAREVTNSVGNGVVHDPNFDWGEAFHTTPPWNEWVIYELHVGTFNDPNPTDDRPGTFADIVRRFDHLKKLGVNCLQVMPVAEFAGDRSWGYNPAHIFAVESSYGGPKAFKEFVREAHRAGFAVILDVVYNHFGPSDLDLWRFDGWSENGGGGIYFYNDWRRETPWGDTRPDYGRPEVRQFIRDNALMWVEDYHVDGLRMDMTLYIRSVRADGEPNLPDGWTLLQWINGEIREKHPNTLTIAEDLQHNDWLTKPVGRGRGRVRQPVGRPVRPPHPRGGDRRGRRTPVDGRGRGRAHAPVQRRRLPAGHLQREPRRGGQRQGSRRRTRSTPDDSNELVRAEAIDAGRGTGVHRAGHPDALPGAGVPRGRMVPRHGAGGLGQATPSSGGSCACTAT